MHMHTRAHTQRAGITLTLLDPPKSLELWCVDYLHKEPIQFYGAMDGVTQDSRTRTL